MNQSENSHGGAWRFHRNSLEVSSRFHRRVMEVSQMTDVSWRLHRSSLEVSPRSLRSVMEVSQRCHGGFAEVPRRCRRGVIKEIAWVCVGSRGFAANRRTTLPTGGQHSNICLPQTNVRRRLRRTLFVVGGQKLAAGGDCSRRT